MKQHDQDDQQLTRHRFALVDQHNIVLLALLDHVHDNLFWLGNVPGREHDHKQRRSCTKLFRHRSNVAALVRGAL
mgnify:CR=1 FL=1